MTDAELIERQELRRLVECAIKGDDIDAVVGSIMAFRSAQIEELRAALEHSDALVGKLTRENEHLADSVQRRQMWLSRAKKDAGYHQNVSFDVVWSDALAALKAARTTLGAQT